jgi:hypothetical protein
LAVEAKEVTEIVHLTDVRIPRNNVTNAITDAAKINPPKTINAITDVVRINPSKTTNVAMVERPKRISNLK